MNYYNSPRIAEALGCSSGLVGRPFVFLAPHFGFHDSTNDLQCCFWIIMFNRQSPLLLVKYRYPYFAVFNSNVLAYDNPKYVYIYYIHIIFLQLYMWHMCLISRWMSFGCTSKQSKHQQPPFLLQTTSINHICCDEFLLVATIFLVQIGVPPGFSCLRCQPGYRTRGAPPQKPCNIL